MASTCRSAYPRAHRPRYARRYEMDGTMTDPLERARLAYEHAGRGCIVSTRRGEEPRYATESARRRDASGQ